MVQGLGLRALTAEGPGLIPGWGTRIPQAAEQQGPRAKKKKDAGIAGVVAQLCEYILKTTLHG